MTDPNARDLIQRLITAIESESRERVISHDLMCSYIEARRWLDARDLTPEHTSRHISDELQEVRAAYNYVDSVVNTADALSPVGGPAWHGWALREAFLAGCSHARSYLSQPEPKPDQLSDGYHTFAELYEHRHALCLALMHAMPQHWWFSKRHSDGEKCFGGDEWFIVGATLPGLPGGSVSYHLPARLWEIAKATGAEELERGLPWDGHTPDEVVSRFIAWVCHAQPEPEGPTDEELMKKACKELGYEYTPQLLSYPANGIGALEAFPGELVNFARAALARYGNRTPTPIPLSERQPTEADCDAEGRCWLLGKIESDWRLISMKNPGIPRLTYCFSHWLPHWALPVPYEVEGGRQ